MADPFGATGTGVNFNDVGSSGCQSDLLSVNNYNSGGSPKAMGKHFRSTNGSMSPAMRGGGGAASVMSFNSGKSSNNPAAEKAAKAKAANKAKEDRAMKKAKLNKYRKLVKEPVL